MPLKLVLSLTIIIIGASVGLSGAEEVNQAEGDKCDIHHGPCSGYISDYKITLDMSPKPVKAMKDITFRVKIMGRRPDSKSLY